VEPSVWTERMLEALENGVKGGKWYSLMDKVYDPRNLQAAWEKVRRNKGAAGVDRQSIENFGRRSEQNLKELHEALKEGRYQPQPVLRKWIEKPGAAKLRPLGIPAVKDRVVQTALCNVMEPVFEKEFLPESHGFRPGRSAKGALREVWDLLAQGYHWVVDADIQSYFDTIAWDILLGEVGERISDGRVLALLKDYLTQNVMDGMKGWKPTMGTPQGAVVSPLLANAYLHPVDVAFRSAGFRMVRYADDLVILCRSENEAKEALALLQGELSKRKLTLHPEKTRLVDATKHGGFDFLGYHFERGYRWPRKKSLDALKDKIREKTKRTKGTSLACIIADLNRTLKGWFAYFKHAHRTTFPRLDGWIRMRLRSILRKRHGGRGRGRGLDHRRWPNAYFVAHGLFTLTTARAAARQSHCGPTDRRAGRGRSACPVRREGEPGIQLALPTPISFGESLPSLGTWTEERGQISL
jgi:RNA-directed DNA polymerase